MESAWIRAQESLPSDHDNLQTQGPNGKPQRARYLVIPDQPRGDADMVECWFDYITKKFISIKGKHGIVIPRYWMRCRIVDGE